MDDVFTPKSFEPVWKPSTFVPTSGNPKPEPEEGVVKRFGRGLLDFPKSIYESVNKSGKAASEHIKAGQYPAALHDVTGFITDPFTKPGEMLSSPSPTTDQSQSEVANQAIGALGLPADETKAAYNRGDYARLAGQATGAAALGLVSHGSFERGNPRPEVVNSGAPPVSKPVLGLPSAPPEVLNAPRFYAGEKGIADTQGKYNIDTSGLPNTGELGTVLPREMGDINPIKPADAPRIGTRIGDISKIETSSPKANIVGLDKVRNGSPVQIPSRSLNDYNIGDPSLPYQTESAPKESKFKPQTFVPIGAETGSTTSTTEPKSFEVAKSLSNTTPSSGVPGPGSAVASPPEARSNSKDINSFRAAFGSVDKTLKSRPETAPIADAIVGAQDKKTQWIATTERDLAQHTAGLDSASRKSLWSILDRGVQPTDNPELIQRAVKIKSILDDVWKQVPGAKNDNSIGFIENYISHVKSMGDDDLASGIKQIWDYHIGEPAKQMFGSAPLRGKGTGVGNMYDQGIGNPNSPFAQTRKGGLKDLEMDVNKVLPAYIESIAKIIHDKPAVDQAKSVLKTLPDTDIYGNPSKIKELSKWYIKNYTRYDSMPGLSEAWNSVTNKLMRTTSRSMLGLNLGLQTLHLARIPANLYPELGEKYLYSGAKEVFRNPKKAYSEAASLGLLQNEVRPWSFKTPMEKADSMLSFWSAADFLDKTIGYHGFKQKFIDAGMNPEEASTRAIAASKKASLTVDPSRAIPGFNPAPGPAGTAWRLSTQFKQVPVKIIEQVLGIAAQAKSDPASAARMVAGIGTAYGLMKAGLHTFHMSPNQFALDMGGASASVMRDVYRKAVKGDVTGALTDTALWLTPAGKSIERQVNKGLSMFESEPSSLRAPR